MAKRVEREKRAARDRSAVLRLEPPGGTIMRCFVAIVALFSMAIFGLILSSESADEARTPVGVAASLIGAGSLMAVLWHDRLDLDLKERTYRRRRGFGPWAQVTTGSLEDGVQIAQRVNDTGEGFSYRVMLNWPSCGHHPFLLANTMEGKKAAQLTQEWSERLEVPVSESPRENK